jgi:hypothetical protein
MLNIVARTIRRQLVIRTPDPASAHILSYMKADPIVEGLAPALVSIDIERVYGFLKFTLASGPSAEGSALYLLSVLHRLHFELTLDESAGCPLIHGGTVTTGEGHIVFVGHKGEGKTTLLVHLASQGWPVTGDEHIILESNMATPRPRSMRVRLGALRYLDAWAADIIRSSPSIRDWDGSPIYAVEPTAFGKEWRIRSLPIRHLVFLHANHGGRSKIRQLDTDRAFQSLLQNVFLPAVRKATALAWLRTSASSANCWELWNGRLEDSEEIIYQTLMG